MTKRRVWRYRCDFCKRSGCSAVHIARHELGCTANPNRECGICKLIGNVQVPTEELVATLAGATQETIDRQVQALSSLCDGCHACMLAAIRQSGVQEDIIVPFDYMEAHKEFWNTRNERCES